MTRGERALVTMVVVQLVHGTEEFVFEFWNAFPPMRAIYGPVLGRAVFILFHLSLVGFGVWCYTQVHRGGEKARPALWAWIVIQGVTLVVHLLWFAVDPRYGPGLATTPLFLVTIAMAVDALRRDTASS